MTKNGKSHTICLPTRFIRSLNLTLRDWLELRLVRGDAHFTVRRHDTYVPEISDAAEKRATVVAYRKVVKNGNGRMFSLPAVFRSQLNLFRHDEVLLVIAHDNKSFTVRPWTDHRIGPPTPERNMSIGEVIE